MTLTPIDATNEVAVTSYLQQARDWLTRAVDETGPEQIAAAKAEIATAAEATKQLGLSKEIQLDAQEMVRRAEYALGKAIRKGQEEGTVARDHGGDRRSSAASELDRPTAFAGKRELYGSDEHRPGIYALADADVDDFDAAIDEARAEGNLSRANVARKAREKSGAAPRSAPRRALADQFFDAAYDLTKVSERIDRLVTDDRFPQNAEKVAAKHRDDLLRAVELLSKALDRLSS